MPKFLSISTGINVNLFDCGNCELNQFLKQKALINQNRMLGGTALLVDGEQPQFSVIGYYTLCPCHVKREVLPKKFGGNFPKEIPAIKLARLAVDKQFQGEGWGGILLAHALRCSYQQSIALSIGYVVLIDVKPAAKSFYEKYGMRLIKESEEGILMGLRTRDIPKVFPVKVY